MTFSLDHAIHILKASPWVDLTHTMTNSSPVFSAFHPPKRTTLFTIEKDGFFAEEIALCTPTGTHIDAPGHFIKNAPLLNELAIKELLLPIYVIHKEEAVQIDHDYQLTVDDIHSYEAQYGIIKEGAFVAFASGWSQRWDMPITFYNLDNEGHAHTPGWSIDALRYLVEKRKIAAIGHETLDTDAAREARAKGFLVAEHYICNSMYGRLKFLITCLKCQH